MLRHRAFSLAALLLLLFSFAATFDLLTLKMFLSQPDVSHYYFTYRNWLVSTLRTGEFPLWNPYWGLGQMVEVVLSIPVDLFTPFELLFGPIYNYLFFVQAFVLCLSGYLVLTMLGLGPWAAILCGSLVLLMPWTNYYFLYYFKTSCFIGNLWLLACTYKFFETKQPRYLFFSYLAVFLSMFGTKVEFWFFNCAAYTIYVVISATSFHFFAKRSLRDTLQLVALSGLPLVLGVLSQAWQINMLGQAVKISGRAQVEKNLLAGLHGLFGSSLKMCLWGFLLAIPFALALLAKGPRRRKNVLVSGALFGIYLLGNLKRNLTYQSFVFDAKNIMEYFVTSSIGAGALLGIVLVWVCTRAEKQDVIRNILRASVLFLIPIYYWCRQGDLNFNNELGVFLRGPLLFRLGLVALVFVGAYNVGRKNLLAVMAYSSLTIFLLMREQGQILLSYTSGAPWIPTRDSYLLEFSLVCLAAVGFDFFIRQALPKTRVAGPLAFAMACGVFWVPFVGNFFPYHWMYEKVPSDYPYFSGIPDINRTLEVIKQNSFDRIYFVNKPSKSQTFGYGEALLKSVPQITLYSGSVPSLQKDWIVAKHTGQDIKGWGAFQSEFLGSRMVEWLPKRSAVGYDNNMLYFYTLIVRPPLDADALRLLGVRYLIQFEQSLADKTVGPYDFGADGDLEKNLARLDLRPVGSFPGGVYIPNLNPENVHLQETLVVSELKNPMPRAFILHRGQDMDFDSISSALDVKVNSSSLTVAGAEFPFRESQISRYEREQVVIEATSNGDEALVLADLHHPNWQVTNNGVAVEMLKAFRVLRMVRLEKGVNRIVFSYELPRWRASFLISVLTILTVLSLWIFSRYRFRGQTTI